MFVNSDQLKKLSLHLLQCFWMTMLEISKWLPKSENVRAPKRMENDAERIKLAVAAKMVKCHPSQRETPTLALRPIENDSALAKVGQNVLLDVVMPYRTIRIHKQNVPPTNAPPRPDDNAQANAREDEEHDC
jgi:hypothetical protein